VARVWTVVRDARDAAVARLAERWPRVARGEGSVTGADLDDAARGVIRDAGYGEWFVHRTGHSIDRELHGSGPHLDNFETADTRALQAGIGFSVEPGVYLPGRFGVRSEINVYLDTAGPEVTPAAPQRDLLLV
jgi:Xaa-Pro dipeptidase